MLEIFKYVYVILDIILLIILFNTSTREVSDILTKKPKDYTSDFLIKYIILPNVRLLSLFYLGVFEEGINPINFSLVFIVNFSLVITILTEIKKLLFPNKSRSKFINDYVIELAMKFIKVQITILFIIKYVLLYAILYR